MKISLLGLIISLSFLTAAAQKPPTKTAEPVRQPQMVRTTSRHETRRFFYGSTLTVVGPPEGSITIESWARNEIDITAEIQLRADSEKDLDLLAAVNTFVLDEDLNHLRVLSTGTHDKLFMKSVAKKFPKALLGLPWRIDYRIRVPQMVDLEINAGRGPLRVADVEGNIQISATESEANLKLIGGTVSATIAVGKINFSTTARSWRGNGAEMRVAIGEISVELPVGFNADINADVLRNGRIENSYGQLDAPASSAPASRQLKVRTGAGGAFFQFTVGDGTIYLKKQQSGGP